MTAQNNDNFSNRPMSWKLAVMGGAYGNVPALQACVDDARSQGCQTMAFIGDAIGCCGHSAEILALINRNFSLLVAGNHEQQAALGKSACGCGYESPEDEQAGCQGFDIALRGISDDHRRWLLTWPSELLVKSPAGPVLLCHGSPERTNEFLYSSQFSKARWRRFLDKREISGFVCTHSGLPWIHRVGTDRFAANCGVVGKPDHDGDTEVHYSILDVSCYGELKVLIRSVRYDEISWAEQLRREGVPEIFISPLETGVWTTGLSSLPESERLVHFGERRNEMTIRTRHRLPPASNATYDECSKPQPFNGESLDF
ncbi:MAG: metallophosphoesterase family protein [Phycisphaerae bacterium]